jgi:hypothetical protein
MSAPICRRHPHQKLICPLCRSARGGKATAERHTSRQLSQWGKLGGRPPKKKKPEQEEPSTEAK